MQILSASRDLPATHPSQSGNQDSITTPPETNLDQPQLRSGEETLASDTAPDSPLASPNLNLDADDEQSQSEVGSHQAPDPGCQELDRNEPAEGEGNGDVGIGQDEGECGVDGPINLEELSDLAHNEEIKIAMDFIRALEAASLDDEGMRLEPEALERLRNPPQRPTDILSPDLRLALDLFIAVGNSSQETYNAVRSAIVRRYPENELLSYAQIKTRIAELSGITPIIHDMCINSCLGYTGPFAGLDMCPQCGEPRYDQITLVNSGGKVKKARQEFHTMPIGPQLQALWRHPDSVASVRYRETRTAEIMEELKHNNGLLASYDDYFHGSEYLEAVNSGRIVPGDMVLMFSIDGAQLYRNKSSDCWMAIWVVFDHSPDGRYKKKFVLSATFIPGPNKPKNSDSYIFPSLHHLAALQKEGLRIWDASSDSLFTSRPFLALAVADGPGMVYLNGLVGYHGKNGCRLYCGVTGRHKPGGSHYYPALTKPRNYKVEGCDHDDIDPFQIAPCSPERYRANLFQIVGSATVTQYKKQRLETGIVKPSIFLGLPSDRISALPGCFGSDIMHLVSLNLPDLLLSLWRGTLDCDKTDDRETWDWAVLKGDTWKTHRKAIAAATPYLPGSFDRPPRNPAEKINSGYKAWEFLMYLFGLGPGMFYNILPEKYWKNYCKLVFGIRIVHQHEIETYGLRSAHHALIRFVQEFEEIYYQRRTDRLHFIRPAIHGVLHLAPEVPRVGPGLCASQWTMERTIGNLTEEIRQPSNPYANLSQRGLRRCQVNALQAIYPELELIKDSLPRGAKDIGNGYILLRAREKHAHSVRICEAEALRGFLQLKGQSIPDHWCPSIHRWARLRLPNGQVARSAWKENGKPMEKVRMARNVKVRSFIFIIYVQFSLSNILSIYLHRLNLLASWNLRRFCFIFTWPLTMRSTPLRLFLCILLLI